MFLRPLVAPFNECANGGGRGVQNIYLVAVNNAPEAVGLRKVRRAFVHQSGRAILQWSIDDVAMARHPTDVRSAPVRVFFFEIEYPLGGEISGDGISAGSVDHAFGFAGGAGRVQDIKRMFGVERLSGTVIRSFGHKLVPPVVAAGLHVDG